MDLETSTSLTVVEYIKVVIQIDTTESSDTHCQMGNIRRRQMSQNATTFGTP